MKVLIKVMIYQGRPTSGGSKKSLLNLIRLLKNDISFIIVLGSNGWFRDQLTKEEIDFTVNLEHKGIQKNKGMFNFRLRKIISILTIFLLGSKTLKSNFNVMKREKVDYVILNETRDFYFLGIPALLAKCKIVSFVRGEPNFYDYPRFLFSYKIVSLSEKLIENFPNYLKDKSLVIPNYVEINSDDFICDTNSNDIIKLSFFGSIIPIKGLENLVEIAKNINNRNFIINIYGDTPSSDYKHYKESILKLVKEHNLQHVFKFHGWKSDVIPYIKDSDIVVLTSKSEGLPRTILEGMSFGKPVVGFDVGGVSSLIENNYNGYLIAYGDNNEFAKKLCHLISNNVLRNEFGKRSREIVEQKFSDNIIREKLSSVFN